MEFLKDLDKIKTTFVEFCKEEIRMSEEDCQYIHLAQNDSAINVAGAFICKDRCAC